MGDSSVCKFWKTTVAEKEMLVESVSECGVSGDHGGDMEKKESREVGVSQNAVQN